MEVVGHYDEEGDLYVVEVLVYRLEVVGEDFTDGGQAHLLVVDFAEVV